MKIKMRFNYLILIIGLIASCIGTPGTKINQEDSQSTVSDEIKDGVFIHVTESYADPHRLLMPLKMATIMADNKDVLVYMDIHAVEVLVNGAEDITMEGFDSAKTYIKILLEKGVNIYACPTCLKVAGFNPEDLAEGIQVAQKDKFFDFTKGKIITLDY